MRLTRDQKVGGPNHIDVSDSGQPLVNGEKLVRYQVKAVITSHDGVQCPFKYLKFEEVGGWVGDGQAIQNNRKDNDIILDLTKRFIVTRKVVLPPASCSASATLEGP